MERFERFRFSVPAVPRRRGFLCVSVQFSREDGSGSGFGSWKTVPAVPVPRSVPGKTVPTVPAVPVPVRFLGHPEMGFPHHKVPQSAVFLGQKRLRDRKST